MFVSAPKHVCEQLLKLNEVKFHGSQSKSKRQNLRESRVIVVSSPAKNWLVVVNENLLKHFSLQNHPLVAVSEIIVKLYNNVQLLPTHCYIRIASQ